MSYLADTLWIESRKAIRSRMPLFTALGFLFLPLGCGFLMFIYKNPDLARQLSLVSAKANLVAGAADWPAYLKLLTEATAAGGFFLFLLITSWVYGREFADGTLKGLLAVPIPRASILLAKFIVVAVWSAALTVEFYGTGLAIGAALGLSQGSAEVMLHGSALLAVAACLTIVSVTPFALLASVGRGYLLPLGVAILTAVLANLTAVAGWGEYFPWAVPVLYAQGKTSLPPVSYWIVFLTGLAGVIATYLWWKYADQNR